MKCGPVNLPNVAPRWSWVLPLVALFFWWATLIALLITWIAKGRPIMDTYHHYMTVYIVYLSNVANSDLQPIFIVGAGGMGIFYIWAVVQDYHLRAKGTFPKPFHWIIIAIHALAIAMAIIAALCILMVSCLRDNREYSRPHSVFVVLFVIFVFVYMCFHTLAFLLYYRHYRIRYFLVGAIVRALWVCVAIVFVVCYGAFMGIGNSQGNRSIYWGYSAIMEWTTVFFYGTMFFIIAWDLRLKSYGDPVKWMVQEEDHQRAKEDLNESPEEAWAAGVEDHELDWDPIHEYAQHDMDRPASSDYAGADPQQAHMGPGTFRTALQHPSRDVL